MVLVTVVVVAVFLTVGAVTGDYSEQDGRHRLEKGSIGPEDRLLYSKEITLSGGSIFVPTYDFCYPPKDSNEQVNITYYNVEAENNKGLAYLSKENNELHNNRVCFHLKTARGKTLKFSRRKVRLRNSFSRTLFKVQIFGH